MQVIKERKQYRLISDYPYYNGCMPVTAYMVQVKQERLLLPDKWITVKRSSSLDYAMKLFNDIAR